MGNIAPTSSPSAFQSFLRQTSNTSFSSNRNLHSRRITRRNVARPPPKCYILVKISFPGEVCDRSTNCGCPFSAAVARTHLLHFAIRPRERQPVQCQATVIFCPHFFRVRLPRRSHRGSSANRSRCLWPPELLSFSFHSFSVALSCLPGPCWT